MNQGDNKGQDFDLETPVSAKPLKLEFQVSKAQAGQSAVDVLSQASGLSKAAVKDAMNKGAVWLQPARGSGRRLRRAQTRLHAGDRLRFCHDPRILKTRVEPARPLVDEGDYGVWYKPAGMLAQGNEWGDHLSLLRQAELWLRQTRGDAQAEVWLVHRLDREASGLMLVAYRQRAAAALSQAFQENRIEKTYLAEVVGETPLEGTIDLPLDGRRALTRYRRIQWLPDANRSRLWVWIETGRKHQIRRHFEAIGHPLWGDPRYGSENRDPQGLRLVACRLRLAWPPGGKVRDYDLARLAPDLGLEPSL